MGQIQVLDLESFIFLFALKCGHFDFLDVLNVLSDWQNIELIIYRQTGFAVAQTKEKSFVKSRFHYVVGLRPIARVHIHGNLVELLKTSHRVQQHHDDATPFDSFHRPAKYVWRETLEVLKDAHSKCLTEDLMCVLVEAILYFF